MAKTLTPGMDDTQSQADRHGWQTTVQFVVGKGALVGADEVGGPEVGNPYDGDPMGEEYNAVTYSKK